MSSIEFSYLVSMKIFANIALLVFAISISLVGGEFASRFVLDPIDYLLPKLIPDPYLNWKIAPHSGGHDEWGFRNLEKPSKVSIVAIGDSLTYGIAASSRDAWPAQLAKLSSKKVYNMGLGGYGPVQYYYLLKTEGIKLKPNIVIVGLYLGNDLMDVYNITHGNQNWAFLAKSKTNRVPEPFFPQDAGSGKKFLGGIRSWLAEKSILYRLITQNRLFDRFRAFEQGAIANDGVQFLNRDRREILFPHRMAFFDGRDKRIVEAESIAEEIFLRMSSLSAEHGIRLIVCLIPTKITAYRKLIEKSVQVKKLFDFSEYWKQEQEARNRFINFFRSKNINFIDTTEALKDGASAAFIYPPTDGHPNAKGYSIIANEIFKVLESGPNA